MKIYTDGGCHGNPGPGGWAFVALQETGAIEQNGHEPNTTNNRMELTAVIRALLWASTNTKDKLEVYTDSQYVQKGISEWIKGWVKNGWKTANKQEVKNKDLWLVLLDLSTKVSVSWLWVKGHAGNEYNERCDSLVQAAISEIE